MVELRGRLQILTMSHSLVLQWKPERLYSRVEPRLRTGWVLASVVIALGWAYGWR